MCQIIIIAYISATILNTLVIIDRLALFFVCLEISANVIMDFDGYTTSPLARESFHSESPLDKSPIDFIIRIFEVNLNTHPIKFFLM
jgi:hypothetical protein